MELLLTGGAGLTATEGRATGFTERRATVLASHVILATGGAGQLFARTTNPAVATGDGIALAYRAGAQLMDLEFIQFHPTALALEGAPSFLISEAVRGEGGILRDRSGHAFMAEYHPDRELAPRDVVARAIHQQMMRTESPVWLDLAHLDAALIERRFPTIVQFCRRWGIEPTAEPIPVAPAAHYVMGGVRTDAWGRTSLPGLLACGEAACTGVHGANRLASNSLLEGLVFARRAVAGIVAGEAEGAAGGPLGGPLGDPEGTRWRRPEPAARRLLAETMWSHVGLVRSDASLSRASQTIRRICASDAPWTFPWVTSPGSHPESRPEGGPEGAPHPGAAECEVANLALLAQLVIAAAKVRTESRGAHFRTDFPDSEPAWRGNLVVVRDSISFVPIGAGEAVRLAADG